jgi:hypothetical protein
VGDLIIREVHFRPQLGGGAIIELQGVRPDCVPLEAIQAHFKGGSISNECSHVVCRYYAVGGSSERLSFRLPSSSDATQCVTDVVLNFED